MAFDMHMQYFLDARVQTHNPEIKNILVPEHSVVLSGARLHCRTYVRCKKKC